MHRKISQFITKYKRDCTLPLPLIIIICFVFVQTKLLMSETLSFALRIAKTKFTRTKIPKFSREAFLATFFQLPGIQIPSYIRPSPIAQKALGWVIITTICPFSFHFGNYKLNSIYPYSRGLSNRYDSKPPISPPRI